MEDAPVRLIPGLSAFKRRQLARQWRRRVLRVSSASWRERLPTSHKDRQQAYRDRQKLLSASRDGWRDATDRKLLMIITELASLRDELRSVTKSHVTSPTPPSIKNLPSEDKDSYKKEINGRATARPSFAAEFEEFWKAWPTRIGKAPARKAFPAAIGKASLVTILTGIRDYVRDKPADRPWLNPATWLDQERWNDELASIPLSKPGVQAYGPPEDPAVLIARIQARAKGPR